MLFLGKLIMSCLEEMFLMAWGCRGWGGNSPQPPHKVKWLFPYTTQQSENIVEYFHSFILQQFKVCVDLIMESFVDG